MVRYAKHNSNNYIVVDSTLEVNGEVLPIQVQVNIQKVKKEDYHKVLRVTSTAFNRHLNFDKPKVQPKKPWWQLLFKN